MRFLNIDHEWELVEKNEHPEEGPAYLIFYRTDLVELARAEREVTLWGRLSLAASALLMLLIIISFVL